MALPYGVMIEGLEYPEVMTIKHLAIISAMSAEPYKPYLRPMSSMTDKEKAELLNLLFDKDAKHFYIDGDGVIDSTMSDLMEEESIYPSLCPINMVTYTNWLNAHHFDFMGLIPTGLAIEVTKDDNPYEY